MGILDGWKLCPRCGTALEPRARGHLACPGCGADYYANSAPAVEGLLERDGRVLVVKRAIEPQLGMWDLPGGFLEEGEEPLDGLRREFLEETELDVRPVEFLGTHLEPYGRYFVLGLTWLVHGDGEPVAGDDAAEIRFIGPDEVPPQMAFPHQLELLRRWAAQQSGAAG